MQIKQYKHLGLAAVTGICLLSLALPLFYRNWGSFPGRERCARKRRGC